MACESAILDAVNNRFKAQFTSANVTAVGQVLASSETTDYATYNFSYNYNLAGALTQETYPSGRVITTGYDSANRVNAVSGTYNGAGTTYVASVSYWPHGAPNTSVYGNTLNVVAGCFSKELQVTGMWHVLAGNANEFLWLEYPNWGTTNNNGTLRGNTEYAGGPAPWTTLPYYTRSYGYDGLNRLTSASETLAANGTTTNTWSRTFNYDPFGNAWVPKVSGVPYGVSTPEWDVYNTKNQVSSSPYDAAGDIAALPGGYSFLYDGEHRVTSETGSGQNYYDDGLGQRVTKVVGSTTTVYVNDAFGNLAAEYAPSNTWSKDYVYFGGQMVTVENAVANPCKTCYLSYDYLGTPRLVTDANANVVARHDYLPFGDEIPEGEAGRGAQYGPYTDNVNQKFTGQYRDPETLNDFFGARYYTAPLMRFLTPDPASLAAVDMSDPQTWNQYAYVRNNPLAFVDPSGMDPANTAPIPVACPGCTVTVTDNDLESVCWWCWEYGIPWTYVPSQLSSQSGQSGQSGPPTSAQQPPPKNVRFCLDPSCTMTTQVPGPSDKEKFCTAQTFKKNALSLGLDVASFGLSLVPGGGIARTIGTTVAGTVLTATSSVLSADNHQLGEALVTFGTGVTTAPPSVLVTAEVGAKTVARALPVVGTIVSGLELGYDGWLAYKDYQACMAHP